MTIKTTLDCIWAYLQLTLPRTPVVVTRRSRIVVSHVHMCIHTFERSRDRKFDFRPCKPLKFLMCWNSINQIRNIQRCPYNYKLYPSFPAERGWAWCVWTVTAIHRHFKSQGRWQTYLMIITVDWIALTVGHHYICDQRHRQWDGLATLPGLASSSLQWKTHSSCNL